MSEEGLPEGWAETRISEVTDDVQSVDPTRTAASEFRYVDISAIDNNRNVVMASEVKKFLGAEAPSRARRPIRTDDIVYSNVRTYLRNTAKVPRELEGALCSTGFTVLRANSAVLPDYLFRSVLTDHFLAAIAPHETGTHYPATSDRAVRGQPLAVPPLAEQRRIVEKVEALLAQVNKARARLAKVPAILKRFRQSILSAACSGRLTDDKRLGDPWKQSEFGDLVESSFYGPRFSDTDYKTTGVPTIRTSDMDREGNIILSSPPRVQLDAADLERFGLRDGDLLVTRTGATIGKCAVYSSSLGPALPSAYLIRFRLKMDRALPRFALLFLMSPEGQEALTGGATATAQPNVNAKTISSISVSVPSLPEQHEIVRRVDALFKLGDAIEARVAASTARADKLTQAILAKAFRGELVPTEAEMARQEGRDYEPASVLLARILAERDANQPAPKSRTRAAAAGPTATAKPARRRTSGRAARSR